MAKSPTSTYLPALAALFVQPAVWAGENLAQLQPWWPKMPWALLTAASAGLLAGMLIQDLYNSSSWLRRWWAARSQLVELTHCFHDEVGGPDHRAREGYATLTFTRDSKNLEIRLWGLVPNSAEPHLLMHEVRPVAIRGDTLRLVIARIAIFRTDLSPTLGETFHVASGEPKKVVIEVRSGWRRQRLHIDVAFIPISDQGRVRLDFDGRYRWAL